MAQSTAPASTFVWVAVGLTAVFIAYGMLTKRSAQMPAEPDDNRP